MSELPTGYSSRGPVSETSIIESVACIHIITVRWEKQRLNWKVSGPWCKELES
jgi:hypothetical protein